ncbi:Salicylate carboxymethyltransferase [Linum perenne]
MTMEVVDVLHMNGGMGENSYAMNSMLQQKVISMTKPITEEAITQLYTSTFPTTISIADLGCSSGPNTLFTVTEIITAVDALSNKLSRPSPEFQVFLNDLPGNDFNTIFRSLFQKLPNKHRTPLFINGVPGSFYGRLFLSNSGLVDNDKLNKFNIPQYTPSAMEVEAEVKREGSFIVDRIAVSKVRWDAYDEDGRVLGEEELKDGGYTVANCMRAVAEPLLIGQFGEGGINVDEVFRRYRAIVTERMANEKTEFVNVTVSLIRDA